MHLAPPEERLFSGAQWLIKLRWIAVLAILLLVFAAKHFFGVSLSLHQIFIIAALLLGLNVHYFIRINKIAQKEETVRYKMANRLVRLQIYIDLFLLTFLLHFSGGVENPVVIYYIFHMIIASILLSKRQSYMVATAGLLLLGTMVLLEYYGIIHHYQLKGFVTEARYNNGKYLVGTGFVFVTTSYLLVYMTSAIAQRLIRQEIAYWEANLELERKDKVKEEYVLRLTHDIKGHLSAIQNSLDVVLLSSDEEEKLSFTQRAYKRVKRLAGFVVELLHLTRLRLLDSIDVEVFAINELIECLVLNYQDTARAASITISTSFQTNEASIKGNRLSIEEVINNLLENAINYTPEGGTIQIQTKLEGDYFYLYVIDSGIGIPDDELDLIFNELYRASNARELESTGSGIGLALVKQIVKSHGGEVFVESSVIHGTTIGFKLPIHKK